VRDAAATLGQALDSALAQTDPDFEVVVVDDGSVDGSASVATAIGDPRIRVVQTAPRGIVHALNTGLAQCKGRYIARLDADDRAAPHRLARQLPLLEADPKLAVVDGRVRFFRDDEGVPAGMQRYGAQVNAILEPADFDRSLLIESPVVHPAATIRRAAIEDAEGYHDGDFPEDYDLWLRLHAAGWRFRKVPEVLVEMRDRPTRLTRTDRRYRRAGFRSVKQRWLTATALSTKRRVLLVGGGKSGKIWLRWLRAQGQPVAALVDVSGKRREAQGTRVIGPDEAASVDADLAIVAVGGGSQRPALRDWMAQVRPGWREGRDWWFV